MCFVVVDLPQNTEREGKFTSKKTQDWKPCTQGWGEVTFYIYVSLNTVES
jgi:hypothetical protein